MGCRWVRGRCGAGGGGWRWGKVGVGMGCRWVRGRCGAGGGVRLGYRGGVQVG